METISIANLPQGTKKKLEKLAIKQGFKKQNGTANLSGYIRKIFDTAIAINS